MRFRRRDRLTGREDWKRLFAQGRSVSAEWLSFRILPNGAEQTRFGCALSRTAARGGVARNRLKRWVREAFRRNPGALPPGLDVAAVILEPPPKLSYQTVQQTYLTLCCRVTSAQKSFSEPSRSTKPSRPQG